MYYFYNKNFIQIFGEKTELDKCRKGGEKYKEGIKENETILTSL